jgi:hypothetical protein
LVQLGRVGVWTVGLDGNADRSLFDLPYLDEPVCLVLGAEGRGLSRLARERCHELVSIPLAGQLNSLNVAAAGAVACFEVARRRAEAHAAPSAGGRDGAGTTARRGVVPAGRATEDDDVDDVDDWDFPDDNEVDAGAED